MWNGIKQCFGWFGKRPFVKAMFITAVAGVVTSIVSCAMCYITVRSIKQTEKALSLTREAVDIQRAEFKLHSRPIVHTTTIQFGGSIKTPDGQVYPHSISANVENIGTVPATHVSGWCYVSIPPGKRIGTFMMPCAIMRDSSQGFSMGLTEQLYVLATNAERIVTATNTSAGLEIEVNLTYSSIGEQTNISYSTQQFWHYAPMEQTFKVRDANIN